MQIIIMGKYFMFFVYKSSGFHEVNVNISMYSREELFYVIFTTIVWYGNICTVHMYVMEPTNVHNVD